MILNLVDDIHAQLTVDQIEGVPPLAKSPGTANPVKVCLVVGIPFSVHGKVKVDHNRHLLHVNTWLIKASTKKMTETLVCHFNGIF